MREQESERFSGSREGAVITLLNLRPYTGEILAPSPNHDERQAPGVEGIVLHATADEGDEALSLSWMLAPRSRVRDRKSVV